MNIRKEAAVVGAGTPDERQLQKINALTKTPLRAEEVYSFRVRLCDDQPDRDNERFDTAALPALARMFCGKTGIFDHNWSAEGQIARIYQTEVCEENGVHFICADCYMLRTEKNAALIAEIEGGIKKEVSVGCAMAQTRCSICGAHYGACEHRKGAVYGGEICYAVLCGPTDAYEFSFVAVPAQREAGVMKAAEGGEWMTLSELVQKAGTPALTDSLRALEQEAAFGRQCREGLLEQVVTAGVALDFGADAATLRKSFGALSFEELSALKAAMDRRLDALFPGGAQLPGSAAAQTAMDADYMI